MKVRIEIVMNAQFLSTDYYPQTVLIAPRLRIAESSKLDTRKQSILIVYTYSAIVMVLFASCPIYIVFRYTYSGTVRVIDF